MCCAFLFFFCLFVIGCGRKCVGDSFCVAHMYTRTHTRARARTHTHTLTHTSKHLRLCGRVFPVDLNGGGTVLQTLLPPPTFPLSAELLVVLSLRPGVGQNRALDASPASRNLLFLIFVFHVHPVVSPALLTPCCRLCTLQQTFTHNLITFIPP